MHFQLLISEILWSYMMFWDVSQEKQAITFIEFVMNVSFLCSPDVNKLAMSQKTTNSSHGRLPERSLSHLAALQMVSLLL